MTPEVLGMVISGAPSFVGFVVALWIMDRRYTALDGRMKELSQDVRDLTSELRHVREDEALARSLRGK